MQHFKNIFLQKLFKFKVSFNLGIVFGPICLLYNQTTSGACCSLSACRETGWV